MALESVKMSLERIAAACVVTGELLEGADRAEFRVEVNDVPTEMLGHKLRLTIGQVTIMAIQLPSEVPLRPLHFGPTQLDLPRLLLLDDYTLRFFLQGDPPVPEVTVRAVSGELLKALSLPTEGEFFAKVQLHHSRYTDPRLLILAARASLGRFPSFAARAAAVTIVAHRLLERDFKAMAPLDEALIQWVQAKGRPLVEEGCLKLASPETASWALVRWTVSLATVCGLLAVYADKLHEARFFFGAAAAQTHLVNMAPVSALNLVNACLIHGLLLANAGEMEAARETLERGVRAYPACVAAQDVMLNVWVIGDLINVAHACRICFIALGRMGLLPKTAEPKLGPEAVLDLNQVKSPLHAILEAGRSPRLAQTVKEIAQRPLP